MSFVEQERTLIVAAVKQWCSENPGVELLSVEYCDVAHTVDTTLRFPPIADATLFDRTETTSICVLTAFAKKGCEEYLYNLCSEEIPRVVDEELSAMRSWYRKTYASKTRRSWYRFVLWVAAKLT